MGIEGVVKAPTASVSEMDGHFLCQQTSPPKQCPVQEESEDDSRALSRKQKTPAYTPQAIEDQGTGKRDRDL
jgi:hypothetical protein